jgi:hypothetical protein
MNQVADYEIVDHGIEHEQYFQGCGTAFTGFDECFTGIGNNPHEALEDALEAAAQSDWDISNIKNTMKKRPKVKRSQEDCWYYVSIRLKAEETEPQQPEEGDYTTEDHHRFYQHGKLVVEVGPDDDWRLAVVRHMEINKFWPNVWFISDHGNAHLLSFLEGHQ